MSHAGPSQCAKWAEARIVHHSAARVMLPADRSSTPTPAAPSPSARGSPPANWRPAERILVSEPSRSPRRKCVGRVLCARTPVGQGVVADFLDIPLVPACRPQPAGHSSTGTRPPSPACAKSCGRLVIAAGPPTGLRPSRRRPRPGRAPTSQLPRNMPSIGADGAPAEPYIHR